VTLFTTTVMLAPFSVKGRPGAALDCSTGTPGSARPRGGWLQDGKRKFGRRKGTALRRASSHWLPMATACCSRPRSRAKKPRLTRCTWSIA